MKYGKKGWWAFNQTRTQSVLSSERLQFLWGFSLSPQKVGRSDLFLPWRMALPSATSELSQRIYYLGELLTAGVWERTSQQGKSLVPRKREKQFWIPGSSWTWHLKLPTDQRLVQMMGWASQTKTCLDILIITPKTLLVSYVFDVAYKYVQQCG